MGQGTSGFTSRNAELLTRWRVCVRIRQGKRDRAQEGGRLEEEGSGASGAGEKACCGRGGCAYAAEGPSSAGTAQPVATRPDIAVHGGQKPRLRGAQLLWEIS